MNTTYFLPEMASMTSLLSLKRQSKSVIVLHRHCVHCAHPERVRELYGHDIKLKGCTGRLHI